MLIIRHSGFFVFFFFFSRGTDHMNLFSHNVPTGIPITWLIGLKNIMENICKDLHIFLIQILFKLSIFTVLSSFYDNFISTDNLSHNTCTL